MRKKKKKNRARPCMHLDGTPARHQILLVPFEALNPSSSSAHSHTPPHTLLLQHFREVCERQAGAALPLTQQDLVAYYRTLHSV